MVCILQVRHRDDGALFVYYLLSIFSSISFELCLNKTPYCGSTFSRRRTLKLCLIDKFGPLGGMAEEAKPSITYGGESGAELPVAHPAGWLKDADPLGDAKGI